MEGDATVNIFRKEIERETVGQPIYYLLSLYAVKEVRILIKVLKTLSTRRCKANGAESELLQRLASLHAPSIPLSFFFFFFWVMCLTLFTPKSAPPLSYTFIYVFFWFFVYFFVVFSFSLLSLLWTLISSIAKSAVVLVVVAVASRTTIVR